MLILNYPKLRFFFYGILIASLLIILLGCLQDVDPLTGTWAYIEENIDLYPPNGDYRPASYQRKRQPLYKELEIRKIGRHEVYYLVVGDKNHRFLFKYLNDSTLFEKNGNDTTLLHYHLRTHTLQFSAEKNNFLGVRELYFPKFKRTAHYQLNQRPLATENFFDFDISNYQSGNINNFVPGRKILPFRISHSFIAKRNINELSINIRLVEPRYKTYDTTGCEAKLTFDPKGYLQNLTCTYIDGQEQWNFIRRNDLNHSLLKIDFSTSDSIQKPKRTYYFDCDEWPVDDSGTKIVDRPGEWQMLDSYVPSRFSLLRSKDFVEFKYNEHHHLTEMALFENLERRGSISFVYNKDGVLTNVNWVLER